MSRKVVRKFHLDGDRGKDLSGDVVGLEFLKSVGETEVEEIMIAAKNKAEVFIVL